MPETDEVREEEQLPVEEEVPEEELPEEEEEEKEEETPEEEEKDYTQEELDAFIADGETEQLKEWGLPQFRSYEEMAKGVKKFFDEDKMVYPIAKELAAEMNMTPHQFMQAVQKKIRETKPAKSKGKEAGTDRYEDRFKALESDRGMVQLDIAFDRFQRRMEKQETPIDVPDDLKSKLVDLLPAVLPREYDAQKINWSKTFEDAYDLYLWRLSKEKDPQKLKTGLSALEARRRSKLKQLGIPSGKTKSKGYSKKDIEAYGEGITKL